MISKVIFNADDFALTSGVSRAIVEAHKKGVVYSTTILGNCDDKLLEEAVELSKQNPDLGIGAHLVLTTRKPLLDTHLTLTNEAGNFKFRPSSLDKTIDVNEVYEEWKAQLRRLKKNLKITHIDSHHHVHMNDELNKVARRLGREFKLPLRSTRDNFPKEIKADLGFYGDKATLEHLKEAMTNNTGLLEIMVHPGYLDDEFLFEISSYATPREQELNVLTSQELKDFIIENKIQVVNYGFINLK